MISKLIADKVLDTAEPATALAEADNSEAKSTQIKTTSTYQPASCKEPVL